MDRMADPDRSARHSRALYATAFVIVAFCGIAFLIVLPMIVEDPHGSVRIGAGILLLALEIIIATLWRRAHNQTRHPH